MATVYAKPARLPRIFLALALLFVLAGCQGGGYTAWDIPVKGPINTGVVTQNAADQPDIAWQTPHQRDALSRQSQIWAQAQSMSEQPVISTAQNDDGRNMTAAPYGASRMEQYNVTAQDARAPQGGKARVVLLLPLTGKHAALGQGMLKAAQMALFDVGNANIELIPRDTADTPEGAAKAAQDAKRQGADLVLGPVFAEDVKQVKAVFARTGTPVVAFTTDWTLADADTYVLGFMPFAQVARVAEYARTRGYGDIAVLAPQTEYSDMVISTLNRVGARVVKVARYSPMQSDLSTIVQDFVDTSRLSYDSKNKIAQVNFDALVLPVGGEALRTIVSLLDAAGLRTGNTRLLGTGLWDDTRLSQDAALFGGWYAAPDPKLRRDFEKHYQDNFGAAPPRLASLAYDATALAAVLAHAAPAGTSPFTRQRMTNPRGFAGIDGIFRFREGGLSERGLAILEIGNRGLRVVDPAPTAFIASGS